MLTGLCMTAGDVEAGRALFELIEIHPLKAKALKEFPALGQGETESRTKANQYQPAQ